MPSLITPTRSNYEREMNLKKGMLRKILRGGLIYNFMSWFLTTIYTLLKAVKEILIGVMVILLLFLNLVAMVNLFNLETLLWVTSETQDLTLDYSYDFWFYKKATNATLEIKKFSAILNLMIWATNFWKCSFEWLLKVNFNHLNACFGEQQEVEVPNLHPEGTTMEETIGSRTTENEDIQVEDKREKEKLEKSKETQVEEIVDLRTTELNIQVENKTKVEECGPKVEVSEKSKVQMKQSGGEDGPKNALIEKIDMVEELGKRILKVNCNNCSADLLLFKNSFIQDGNGLTRYFICNLLGKGTYGQVALCLDILSQTQVAIKISKNDGNGRLNALKELEYTKILNSKDPQHNYFVHLIGDFESKSGHICLVFEKLELNLITYLKIFHPNGMPLISLAKLAKQLLEGLVLLRESEIMHCDLKPDNIMVQTKNGEFESVKIIDFGLAYSTSFTTRLPAIQTPRYCSPEVASNQHYGCPVDIWSTGAIIVEAFLGCSLFISGGEMGNLERISGGLSILELRVLNHEVDEERKDKEMFFHFLRGIFILNPELRWKPQEALQHPFITGNKDEWKEDWKPTKWGGDSEIVEYVGFGSKEEWNAHLKEWNDEFVPLDDDEEEFEYDDE